MSDSRVGPVGAQPVSSRVRALDTGASVPTKPASQPKCSRGRGSTGRSSARPIASRDRAEGDPLFRAGVVGADRQARVEHSGDTAGRRRDTCNRGPSARAVADVGRYARPARETRQHRHEGGVADPVHGGGQADRPDPYAAFGERDRGRLAPPDVTGIGEPRHVRFGRDPCRERASPAPMTRGSACPSRSAPHPSP